jgi:hypothetical protein
LEKKYCLPFSGVPYKIKTALEKCMMFRLPVLKISEIGKPYTSRLSKVSVMFAGNQLSLSKGGLLALLGNMRLKEH